MMIERDWHGAYSEGWTGIITPDSFAHPAKFSRGLIRRIYDHLFEQGYLKEGDSVVDPFGGVALGALHAMQHGCHWIGVELEQTFCDMGIGCDCTGFTKADWRRYQGRFGRIRTRDGRHICPECMKKARPLRGGKIPCSEPHHYTGNIELWLDTYAPHFPKWGSAVLIQGDSRELVRVVGQVVGASVGSPPYAESLNQGNDPEGYDYTKYGGGGQLATSQRYGQSAGQLGAMPAGDLQAAVSSSPYTASLASDDPDKRGGLFRDPKRRGDKTLTAEYGESAGQLGTMKEGDFAGCVSSPPWEESLDRGVVDKQERVKLARTKGISNAEFISPIDMEQVGKRSQPDYGNTAGQLGQEQGDTFWSAARTIVEQTHQVLAPGAVAVWVCKSFVRKKKRVDFPNQWRELCEACGFETIEWIRAWLVEDRGNARALFDFETDKMTVKQGETVHSVGKRSKEIKPAELKRCSFFRKLAEKKGSPHIDYEVVIIQRRI